MKKQISLAALVAIGLTTFTYAATPLLNLKNVFPADPTKSFEFGYTENQTLPFKDLSQPKKELKMLKKTL